MAKIEVDFDVFKELTNRRQTESMSENDALRALLALPPANTDAPQVTRRAWTWKGVSLPDGTQLRAEYKGRAYTAEVIDGSWTQDGKTYASPSAAAYAITGSGVNGWGFWSVKRPGDSAWKTLHQLRVS